MIFIGIDPGTKGGISILDLGDKELPTKETVPALHRMPTCVQQIASGEQTLIDVQKLADILLPFAFEENVEIWIEHLWDFGSASLGTGDNAFSKAANYGDVRTVVRLSTIPWRYAAPKSWQAAIKCPKFPKTPEGYKARKKWLADQAIQLYPKGQFIPKRCRVPQDGLTDATLIADYGAKRHYMEKFGGKKIA